MVQLGREANPILWERRLVKAGDEVDSASGQTTFRSWDDGRATCSEASVRIR